MVMDIFETAAQEPPKLRPSTRYVHKRSVEVNTKDKLEIDSVVTHDRLCLLHKFLA